MNQKLTSLVACSIAIAVLSIVVAGLAAYVVLSFDKQSALHDRLIASEQMSLDWEKAYGRLLERVGGAELPNLPPPPKRPGNTGAK